MFEVFYYHTPSTLTVEQTSHSSFWSAAKKKKKRHCIAQTDQLVFALRKKKWRSVVVQRAYSSRSAWGDIRLWGEKTLLWREAAIYVMIPGKLFHWKWCSLWHTLNNVLGLNAKIHWDHRDLLHCVHLLLHLMILPHSGKLSHFFRLMFGCMGKVFRRVGV